MFIADASAPSDDRSSWPSTEDLINVPSSLKLIGFDPVIYMPAPTDCGENAKRAVWPVVDPVNLVAWPPDIAHNSHTYLLAAIIVAVTFTEL